MRATTAGADGRAPAADPARGAGGAHRTAYEETTSATRSRPRMAERRANSSSSALRGTLPLPAYHSTRTVSPASVRVPRTTPPDHDDRRDPAGLSADRGPPRRRDDARIVRARPQDPLVEARQQPQGRGRLRGPRGRRDPRTGRACARRRRRRAGRPSSGTRSGAVVSSPRRATSSCRSLRRWPDHTRGDRRLAIGAASSGSGTPAQRGLAASGRMKVTRLPLL